MSIVTVHQPVFVPYCGIIAKILFSDIFVELDDVKTFNQDGFINRNQIPTRAGIKWLTIPCEKKGEQYIHDIRISGDLEKLRRVIFGTIQASYAKAPYYEHIQDMFDYAFDVVKADGRHSLTLLNRTLLKMILRYFEWNGKYVVSSDLGFKSSEPTERLADIMGMVDQNGLYISGANGRQYMYLQKFPYSVMFQKYEVAPYRQAPYLDDFVPYMSIIDFIAWNGFDRSGVMSGHVLEQ